MIKIDETLPINIRPMSANDLKKVLEIEKISFTDPWPESAFREGLTYPLHNFVVADHEGEIAGYASYYIELGEARLTNIAVAPEYRRKSIAKRLIKYILEVTAGAGCNYIFLDVRPSNKTAIDLYRKFGFFKLYDRPDYYSSPREDAAVMVKHLNED